MADDNRIIAVLAYFFTILGGIAVYLWKKDDAFLRFHAMQSILFTIAGIVVAVVLGILGVVPVVGIMVAAGLGFAAMLAFFGIWVYLMYRALHGDRFGLPVIGPMAEKYSA
ncbi:DUF4870 domain-containing protein [Candidatus Micrarchaeota archaeon]|nr:DUF4870 domain-containing protein [Candidatus Micrarchaeota archaeon]